MKTAEEVLTESIIKHGGIAAEVESWKEYSDYKAVIEAMEEYASQSKWISVEERLPGETKFNMSDDVLTISGSKQSVKSYDFKLKKWSGSPYVTVTHWQPLPEKP